MADIYLIEMYEDTISGFTTYKDELSYCIISLGHSLHHIVLYAPIEDFAIETDANAETIKIPYNICKKETFGCLLSLYIKDSENTVFIQNFAISYPILSILKSYFPLSRLVYVIHDFIWASYLMGDIDLFKKVINKESYTKDYEDIASFYEDGLKSFAIADKTVCLSKDTYKLLSGFYKVNRKNLVYIPNGLRESPALISYTTNKRKELSISKNDKIFLYVGRATKQKGVFCLLTAFEMLCKNFSNAFLVVAGSFKSEFISQIPKSVLRKVLLLGPIKKYELYQWYREADFCVIPSYYEQCSYTGIETKMFSLPTIASDAFGVRCMFNKTNSIVFQLQNNKNDVSALYKSLKKAMETCDYEYREFQKKSRQHYKRTYSFEKMCENYKTRLFKQLNI